MVPKVLEPLKFYCIYNMYYDSTHIMYSDLLSTEIRERGYFQNCFLFPLLLMKKSGLSTKQGHLCAKKINIYTASYEVIKNTFKWNFMSI